MVKKNYLGQDLVLNESLLLHLFTPLLHMMTEKVEIRARDATKVIVGVLNPVPQGCFSFWKMNGCM